LLQVLSMPFRFGETMPVPRFAARIRSARTIRPNSAGVKPVPTPI